MKSRFSPAVQSSINSNPSPRSHRQACYDRRIGFFLSLPLVTLIVLLSCFPVYRVIMMSLEERGLYSPTTRFVGLANFSRVFQHEGFWRAFNNTLVFSFGGLALQTLMGLLIALLHDVTGLGPGHHGSGDPVRHVLRLLEAVRTRPGVAHLSPRKGGTMP